MDLDSDAFSFRSNHIKGGKEMKERTEKFGGGTYEEWCARFRLHLLLRVPERLEEDEAREPQDLQTKRNRIRARHVEQLRKYKDQRAPGCHIHHEWIPGTATYRGVAFVEAKAHFKGIIKVIEVLDGEITLFVEKRQRCGFSAEKDQKEMRERYFRSLHKT